MTPVFADTEYWIAINSPRDDLYACAVAVTQILRNRPIVTSEMVLAEFLDGCATRGENVRRMATAFVRGLSTVGLLRICPQTSALFLDALTLYESRADKEWSLTDCSSIVICQQENIIDVLTHDHHFAQAGLNALLREPIDGSQSKM